MRLMCSVPYCRCSRGDRKGDPVAEYTNFVCHKHWVAVPSKMRKAYQRRRRIWKRSGLASDDRAQWRLFKRCERYAIEKALGI